VELLVFRTGAKTFGISLDRVGTVFPVVEIDELPNAPGTVRGIVNIRGTITPVVDLQRRFTESHMEPSLDQRLIVVFVGSRQFALLADDVDGVHRIPDASITDMEIAIPGAGIVTSVAAIGSTLTYIYDLGELLSAAEEALLDAALRDA
jgi:chemotaxis signal transduction protein